MTRRITKTGWAALALSAAGVANAQVTASGAAPLPVAPFGPGTSAAALRWEVKATDVTLAKTLERWAAAAGHRLKWDASRDFLIGAPDQYVGTFEGALQHVLRSPGIRYSDHPLEACVYANTPPLVRITRQGEQARECVAAPAP